MMSHPALLCKRGVNRHNRGEKAIRTPLKSALLFLTLPLLSALVACFAFTHTAQAVQTVPYKLNFQGRLTDSTGAPLTGSYDMQLKLYTASTSGTFIWGETRTAAGSNPVAVTNGIFSVLIGEGTAVAGSAANLQAAIAADPTMYLEVTVGSEVLSPRSQLGSSAYAVNADMLDGLDSSYFAPASGSTAYAPVSGSINYIQNGTTQQASSSFNISGTGTIGGAGTVTGNFTNNGSAMFANTVNSTSAFAIQTSTAAKLFVADTTNSRIYIGDSAVGTNAVVLVLDNSSQATDPVAVTDGAMYFNTTMKQFRCARDGDWEPCGTDAVDRGWSITEDFLSGAAAVGTGIGNMGWTAATMGTACSAYSYNNTSAPAPSADRAGIFRMVTSTTPKANAGCRIYLGTTTGGTMMLGAGQVFKAAVAPGSSAAGAIIMRVGNTSEAVASNAAITTGSGVWWEANPTLNANWQYCYGNGTTAVCAPSATTIASTVSTMTRFEAKINTVGTGTSSADFFINGVKSSVSAVTINTAIAVRPNFMCSTGATATASTTCNIDYFQIRDDSSAAR